MAQATAPILDSTQTDLLRCLVSSRYWGVSGHIADMLRPPPLTLAVCPLRTYLRVRPGYFTTRTGQRARCTSRSARLPIMRPYSSE